jgi:hypothetical protein
MDEARAREVAGSLTPGQKRAVLSGHETLFGKQVLLPSTLNCIVARNLEGAGLAIVHDPYRMRLTPFGQLVRHILQQEERG